MLRHVNEDILIEFITGRCLQLHDRLVLNGTIVFEPRAIQSLPVPDSRQRETRRKCHSDETERINSRCESSRSGSAEDFESFLFPSTRGKNFQCSEFHLRNILRLLNWPKSMRGDRRTETPLAESIRAEQFLEFENIFAFN